MTDTPGNFPKISPETIERKLGKCQFECIQPEGRTSTFVNVYDPKGYFLATGHSACVDPRNYDAQKGIEYARIDALGKAENKLWELEGYALKKDLEAGRYILSEAELDLPPFVQRMIVEANELAARLANLQKFLNQPQSQELTKEERDLLVTQAQVQGQLLEILQKRSKLLQKA